MDSVIYQVWKNNLPEAFDLISEILDGYPYVSLDTEFPGIVARPTADLKSYNYKSLQCNVDLTNIVQLGLTFSNSKGERPRNNPRTFQFNFAFDLENDIYFHESVEFLKNAGIDFTRLHAEGIELHAFGELLTSSGLIMNEDISWIVCHGCFDLGFVYKLATSNRLPLTFQEFKTALGDYFPHFYDVKYIVKSLKLPIPQFSLKAVAEYLENIPIPDCLHQAGYDSQLIDRIFFRLVSQFMDNKMDDSLYGSFLYGIETPHMQNLPAGMLRLSSFSSSALHAARMINNQPGNNSHGQWQGQGRGSPSGFHGGTPPSGGRYVQGNKPMGSIRIMKKPNNPPFQPGHQNAS